MLQPCSCHYQQLHPFFMMKRYKITWKYVIKSILQSIIEQGYWFEYTMSLKLMMLTLDLNLIRLIVYIHFLWRLSEKGLDN